MLPNPSRHNHRNSARINAEGAGQSPSVAIAVLMQSSNLANVFFCKMAHTVKRTLHSLAAIKSQNLNRMHDVFFRRDVFEVEQSVVALNSVAVVDLNTIKTRAEEGQRNHSMHPKRATLAISRKSLVDVAARSKVSLQDQTFRCDVAAPLAFASYASQVRNSVIAIAWNRFPSFARKFFGGKFVDSHAGSPYPRMSVVRLVQAFAALVRAACILTPTSRYVLMISGVA
jgi:hypothetical protein